MRRSLPYRFMISWMMLFILTGAHSQVTEIKTWLDSSMIRIGEQVKFHLEVKKAPRAEMIISDFSEILPGTMEIISDPLIDTLKTQDSEVVSHIYTLTAFDSGVHVIPPIPITFDCRNTKDTIYSNPLDLHVYFPEVDTTQVIKDIKPPIKTPLSFAELLPYIGMTAGALILAVLFAYLYLRLRKKKSFFVKPKERIPAHVTAFAELDKLKDEKLWQSGKVKEFYSRLSDIIRVYLEDRYNFRSMECVTDEIMDDFRKANEETEVEEMLSELLHMSDMVKFAKGDPLPAENQSILNNAYFIVEKTKLVEMKSLEELAKENSVNDKSMLNVTV